MTNAEKANLFRVYSRANFPRIVWNRLGNPWLICANQFGICAAIPRDPESGSLPSHFGNLEFVAMRKRQQAARLMGA